MGSRAFRENEADISFLDLLFGFDKSSYGVAVSVYGDSSADTHDEPAEPAVVSLKIGSRKAAHPFEVALGQIVDDKNSVRVALMV